MSNAQSEPLKRSVLSGKYYKLLQPDKNYKGMSYSNLITDWYNWVYSVEPDHRIDPVMTYLRGNLIGDPFYPETLNLRPGDFSVVEDPRTIYDRTGLRGITITDKTALFGSVYDTIFVIGDKYKGKELQTTNDCRTAAREEFSQLSAMWATYRVYNDNDGKWSKAEPLVPPDNRPMPTLHSFYAESTPFILSVPAGNRINREPAYYLSGPKQYVAVALGIFVLLYNLEANRKYRIDFGGISGIDYFTRAIYDIKVVDAKDEPDKDVSGKMIDRPYPPDEVPKV